LDAHWWVGEDARSLATAWEWLGVVCAGATRAGGGGDWLEIRGAP